MADFPTIVPVVAVALIDAERRVLLQQRRIGAHHGGLWEFPGGKVELGESLESALLREIEEELGIALDIASLDPAAFSADARGDRKQRDPHVILLYTCRAWRGEPRCLEGEAIGWFSADEAARLEVPPLDRALIARLPAMLA